MSPEEQALYDKLREWRNQMAQSQDVPPYMIFPNPTLKNIALRKPKNVIELKQVPDVSERKIEKFGSELLKIILGDGTPIKTTTSQPEENVHLSQIFNTISEATGFTHGQVMNVTTLNKQILEVIKKSVKKIFGDEVVWVTGEIVEIRNYSDHRTYFDIIDEDGLIVCRAQKADVGIKTGQQVVCGGKLTVTQWQGNSWIILLEVSEIRSAGAGALSEAQEKTREILEQRGFFDAYRHKKLPRYPKNIAFITLKDDEAKLNFYKQIEEDITLCIHYTELTSFNLEKLKSALKQADSAEMDLIILASESGADLDVFDNPEVVELVANLNTPLLIALGGSPKEYLAEPAADYCCANAALAGQKVMELWQKESVSPTNVFTYIILILAIILLIFLSYMILLKVGFFRRSIW